VTIPSVGSSTSANTTSSATFETSTQVIRYLVMPDALSFRLGGRRFSRQLTSADNPASPPSVHLASRVHHLSTTS